jgi:hypothetical protein
MLDRVVSGGQTGADLAGWRAAKLCGLPTGGWMPLGFLTEDGARPEFAGLYGATEMSTDDHPTRTRKNVFESSATTWFGSLDSPGYLTTERACLEYGRSMFKVAEGENQPADVVAWLRVNGFRVLNVAGHRESRNPGIEAMVERFLVAAFRQLARG